MVKLQDLSRGFAAGAVGALVLTALVLILSRVGPAPDVTVAVLYKNVTWGGLWGLLLALPWLTGKWWLRGLILGVAALVVLAVLFMPGGGDPNPVRLIIGIVLHLVWGLTTAYWYKLTA